MLKYEEEIEVQFRDLDGYGHVNNAVYLSYFETARINMVKEIFINDMKNNIQQIVISAHADYLQPVLFGERAIISCCVTEITKAKYKIDYKIHNGDGKRYATGYTVHALFDNNKKRPVRLSTEIINALS